MVTDSKLLYDYIQKTGSTPKERHVVELAVVKMKWVLATHQLADTSAKEMPMNGTFWEVLEI